MPEWLTIVIAVLGGLLTSTTVFGIWLRPLFKMREDINKNTDEIVKLKEHQEADYKRGIRSEKLMKAQIKALLALISHQISGDDLDVMKTVQKELQDNLTELI